MNNVIVYIDGFNLYYGLKDSNLLKHRWLNLYSLAHSFLVKDERLIQVKYFTAIVTNNRGKTERQQTYLQALKLMECCECIFGEFYVNERTVADKKDRTKVVSFDDPQEKGTDINIAVEVLMDAMHDQFDTAYILSADSDLVPVLHALKSNFPGKRVIAVFPPGRRSHELRKYADGHFVIDDARLLRCQFPETVERDGKSIRCPDKWRADR